jgi:quercetin dioxygenase-like cupin family protein
MIKHIDDVKIHNITHPSAFNAGMKVLVGEEQGWDDYVMRLVEVEPGGYTPKHSHPWPHINIMLEGQGEVLNNGEYQAVKAGSFSFIEADTLHQFRNTGDEVFKFICIVPKEGHQ